MKTITLTLCLLIFGFSKTLTAQVKCYSKDDIEILDNKIIHVVDQNVLHTIDSDKLNHLKLLINYYAPEDICFLDEDTKITVLLNNYNMTNLEISFEECKQLKELKIGRRNDGSYRYVNDNVDVKIFSNNVAAGNFDKTIKQYKIDVQCKCKDTGLEYWKSTKIRAKSIDGIHPVLGRSNKFYYELNHNNDLIIESDINLGNKNDRNMFKPNTYRKKKIYSLDMLKDIYGNRSESVRNIGVFQTASTATSYSNEIWPYGEIPYIIESGFPEAEVIAINNAIEQLQESTSLNFFPKNEAYDNHIIFRYDNDLCNVDGCGQGNSPVGMRDLPNIINLKNGSVSLIIHEILHSLGFFHEHTRPDRDNFIEIIKENVVSESSYDVNFSLKESSEVITSEEYDKSSIMHYGGYTFTKNSDSREFPTIIDKATGEPLIRSNELSVIDIDGIHRLYSEELGKKLIPSDPTKNRQIKLIVDRIDVDKDSDELFSKQSAYPLLRISDNAGWSYNSYVKPKYINNRFNHTTYAKRYPHRKHDEHYLSDLKWNVSCIIPSNERYGQAYFRLYEHDKLSPDDDIDSNVFENLKGVYIQIDTYSQEVWLSDSNRNPKYLIGFIGNNFVIEGNSENTLNAKVGFRIEMIEVNDSRVERNN